MGQKVVFLHLGKDLMGELRLLLLGNHYKKLVYFNAKLRKKHQYLVFYDFKFYRRTILIFYIVYNND